MSARELREEVEAWLEAGLLFPSVVTAIYRTIKRTMIERKLGTTSARVMAEIGAAIRVSLGVGS